MFYANSILISANTQFPIELEILFNILDIQKKQILPFKNFQRNFLGFCKN